MMTCPRCGGDNLPSARFCAVCGTRFQYGAAGTLAPPAAAAPVTLPMRPAPVSAPMLLACHRCGRAMRPIPYFSRGVNIAKAMALMIPFSVVGPLAFFFLRKDRLVCGFCKGLMSGEVAVPLLHAFTPDGRALSSVEASLGGLGGLGALAVYESEDSVVVLEHQGRRQRSRALVWGTLSGALAALGALMAGTGDPHSALGFLVMAAPPGLGAWVSALRSRGFTRRAASRRGLEQRSRILELARAAGGRLNVTAVATDLRVELADAEAILNAMVDGHRIEMDVDDAGRITYVFTELGGR